MNDWLTDRIMRFENGQWRSDIKSLAEEKVPHRQEPWWPGVIAYIRDSVSGVWIKERIIGVELVCRNEQDIRKDVSGLIQFSLHQGELVPHLTPVFGKLMNHYLKWAQDLLGLPLENYNGHSVGSDVNLQAQMKLIAIKEALRIAIRSTHTMVEQKNKRLKEEPLSISLPITVWKQAHAFIPLIETAVMRNGIFLTPMMKSGIESIVGPDDWKPVKGFDHILKTLTALEVDGWFEFISKSLDCFIEDDLNTLLRGYDEPLAFKMKTIDAINASVDQQFKNGLR